MAQSDSLEALLVQRPTPTSSQRESFLHIGLTEEASALVALQHSAEVLNIARKDILPLFFMPAWVTGIYNLRGEILWIVDLSHLLGLAPCYEQRPRIDFTVLVLQANQIPATGQTHLLGCIVRELESIEHCDTNNISAIQPPTMRYSIPASLLKGYWTKSATETIAVLDVEAMMQSLSQIV